MKLRKLLSVILLALIAVGCTKEDLSDCVTENDVTLRFVLKEQDGVDKFSQHVNVVDLLIFDEDGLFVRCETINERMLAEFQGKKTKLAPGTYYVVCWGNVRENSALSALTPGVTSINDCFIEIPASATKTGDPIYYAPYVRNTYSRAANLPQSRSLPPEFAIWELVVPPMESVEKEVNFIRAHRTINAYVEGLVDEVNGTLYAPIIELEEAWSRYNFLFETLNYRTDLSQQSVLANTLDGQMYFSQFHVGFGEVIPDINVIIRRGSDREVIAVVNLKQFLTNHPDENKNDIHIQISFLDDHGVTISVPGWIIDNIQPGN